MGCVIGQYGSPFSDGTPQASQWPIPPGKYFDYEFKFDLNVSGTLYILRHFLHISFDGLTFWLAGTIHMSGSPSLQPMEL
jgi:L-ascorbate oxidase